MEFLDTSNSYTNINTARLDSSICMGRCLGYHNYQMGPDEPSWWICQMGRGQVESLSITMFYSNHTKDAWRRRLRIEIHIPRFQIVKQYSQVTSSAYSTVARCLRLDWGQYPVSKQWQFFHDVISHHIAFHSNGTAKPLFQQIPGPTSYWRTCMLRQAVWQIWMVLGLGEMFPVSIDAYIRHCFNSATTSSLASYSHY